jgi:tetratricopeptide (TPR) repeat protein
VKERTGILVKYILFFCFSFTPVLQGQILKDTASVNLLKTGVDEIYNLRFDKARAAAQQLNHSLPEHPVIYLLNGMITYWENYPLIPSSPASLSYESDMRNCIRICEETHDNNYYAEYLMANLGARGMLLMYYADNNLTEKVIPLAKSTYRYLRQSFDYTSVFSDFYFFTGLYNYYREAYPDAHPIYKVVAFLFPKGDIAKGLGELQTAAQNSIILRAESLFFLSLIYTNFENNYKEACLSSKSLYELYPANLQYLAGYVKSLLLAKKYNEAETIIKSSKSEIGNFYFQAQLSILNGILQEKKYHNYAEARKYYNKGISDISAFGYYGNEYAAYAYFGLSRAFEIEGDKRNRKICRKKALELTDFKKVNFDD